MHTRVSYTFACTFTAVLEDGDDDGSILVPLDQNVRSTRKPLPPRPPSATAALRLILLLPACSFLHLHHRAAQLLQFIFFGKAHNRLYVNVNGRTRSSA